MNIIGGLNLALGTAFLTHGFDINFGPPCVFGAFLMLAGAVMVTAAPYESQPGNRK